MFSVVIPLYNKASDISRAVRSVQTQTCTDWELIVVDDGSRDDGPARVEAIDDARVRLVRQANAGVSVARNRGANEACSDWVCFLDADDHWQPNHLEMLSALLAKEPGLDLYATAYSVVDEVGHARPIRLSAQLAGHHGRLHDYFAAVMDWEHPIHSSAVMVRKTRFLSMGGFQPGLAAGEDILMWARYAARGPIGYAGFYTMHYVAPPASANTPGHTLRRPPRDDVVGRALTNLMHQATQPSSAMPRFLAQWFRNRAMLYMELGERWHACQELVRAMRAEGGVQLRDVVSVALMVLPLRWQREVLAGLRRARKKA